MSDDTRYWHDRALLAEGEIERVLLESVNLRGKLDALELERIAIIDEVLDKQGTPLERVEALRKDRDSAEAELDALKGVLGSCRDERDHLKTKLLELDSSMASASEASDALHKSFNRVWFEIPEEVRSCSTNATATTVDFIRDSIETIKKLRAEIRDAQGACPHVFVSGLVPGGSLSEEDWPPIAKTIRAWSTAWASTKDENKRLRNENAAAKETLEKAEKNCRELREENVKLLSGEGGIIDLRSDTEKMWPVFAAVEEAIGIGQAVPELVMRAFEAAKHDFTCPNCGSHRFGTGTTDDGKSYRYCGAEACTWSSEKWDGRNPCPEDSCGGWNGHAEGCPNDPKPDGLPKLVWCHSDNKWFGPAMPGPDDGGWVRKYILHDVHLADLESARREAIRSACDLRVNGGSRIGDIVVSMDPIRTVQMVLETPTHAEGCPNDPKPDVERINKQKAVDIVSGYVGDPDMLRDISKAILESK